jgi:DNA-binding beta-propeller fold protein YncE
MKSNMKLYRKVIVVIGIALLIAGITKSSRATDDILYVSDFLGNTVTRFNASGVPLDSSGHFIQNSSDQTAPHQLLGPDGLIFNGKGELLVVNQNVGAEGDHPGEVFRYNGVTGSFLGALIPAFVSNLRNQYAPFAPRGIVLSNSRLFVASQEEFQSDDGKLWVYTKEGEFIFGLIAPPGLAGQFHPRGVVFGPDGLLYVSNVPTLGGLHGQILRYDPKKIAFKDVFVSDVLIPQMSPPIALSPGPDQASFNRPEGLVFGPDGNLYVTSFRNRQEPDNDKILIFAGPGSRDPSFPPGSFISKIDLDAVSPPDPPPMRTYAQALLFGPKGKLYVPISNTGEIRVYNVSTKGYNTFVPSGLLMAPQYLTFGKTDPATLAYPAQ